MLALEYAAQNLLHAAGYYRYSSHYQSRHVETTARNIVHRTGVEEGQDGECRCGVSVGLSVGLAFAGQHRCCRHCRKCAVGWEQV